MTKIIVHRASPYVIEKKKRENPLEEEVVISFEELRSWIRTGKIFSHLFRYREAKLVTYDINLLSRPFASSLLMWSLSWGKTTRSDRKGNDDVIIVSEVMEHLYDSDYPSFFELIYKKLTPNGRLFVTVSNGYGWFEIESYFYYKKNLGKLLDKLKITYKLDQFKNFVFKRGDWVNTIPSTLCSTPHVQKFTYKSIQKLLEKYNFQINSITGSVLFAGPLSDRIITGFQRGMRANNFLGIFVPRIASGFYVECQRRNAE